MTLADLAMQAGVVAKNNVMLQMLRNKAPSHPIKARAVSNAPKTVSALPDNELTLNHVTNLSNQFPESKLPLEVFDDHTLMNRLPAEFRLLFADISFGQNIYKGLLAHASHHGGWIPCVITDWSEESFRYTATFSDGSTTFKSTAEIYFNGESLPRFYRRLLKAYQDRAAADAALASDAEIAKLVTDKDGGLRPGLIARLRKLATIPGLHHPFDLLINEVIGRFRYCQHRKFVVATSAAPRLGLYQIGPHSTFERVFTRFCEETLLLRPEGQAAIFCFFSEFQALSTTHRLFQLQPSPLPPAEFSARRLDFARKLLGLRDTWMPQLRANVSRILGSVDPVRFNLQETSRFEYGKSKLKRLLGVAGQFFSRALFKICKTSFEEFAEFLENREAIFLVDVFGDKNGSLAVSVDSLVPKIDEIISAALSGFTQLPSLDRLFFPFLFPDTSTQHPGFEADDNWLKSAKGRIIQAVALVKDDIASVLGNFDIFPELVKLDVDAYVANKCTEEPVATSRELLSEIYRFGTMRSKVEETFVEENVHAGLAQLNFAVLKKQLFAKLDNVCGQLRSLLSQRLSDQVNATLAEFQLIGIKLGEPAGDIEKVAELNEYMTGQLPNIQAKLAADGNEAAELARSLEAAHFHFPDKLADDLWKLRAQPSAVVRRKTELGADLAAKREIYQTEMIAQQDEFNQRLLAMEETVLSLKQFTREDQIPQVMDVVNSINWNLRDFSRLLQLFNSREILFGTDPTDYSQVANIAKSFEPFNCLWSTLSGWRQNQATWTTCAFRDIPAADVDLFISTGIRQLFKAVKGFRENSLDQDIPALAEAVKEELESFKPSVALIVALRNPGMRERHWQQASIAAGIEVNENLNLLEMTSLLNKLEECDDIGNRANKEYALEKALAKMKADWESIFFQCKEQYRNTNTYILKGTEDALALLDEHLVTTQAMQFSAFKGPFEKDIAEWDARLSMVSETLDAWLKCQRSWMYLQPIFESDDIIKQLPGEARRFAACDKVWRACMLEAHRSPKVIEICSTEGLLDKWVEANEMLDKVQKGLEDYLETKRAAFARFYFLSNEELLEILSQTKDPTRVQPFLSKVFEAMAKLTFSGEENIITDMSSAEGETLPFVNHVRTRGVNVEGWMMNVEVAMQQAVRAAMERGIRAYSVTERRNWVVEHPAQCALNGSQVFWTIQLEGAIKQGTVSAYCDILQQQLLDLVALVRSGLNASQRTSVGALIVIDVHAKDVAARILTEKIQDINAFEWISQLRYYWEVDDRKHENLWIRCVQTSFPYGYEYLGNSFRLVITPLTDMCYMTLLGAQSLNLGGAPAGPAGTGKTETTKDLAKALAKQCVVFNCSPEMDYIMVGKFFKGLASSGAWCCFDEFNRINIEVLSVIAQQLLVLFGAKAELVSYNASKLLVFEESEISMKPTFNVFITMNPGYAGRTELPDNLQALFRPVAMMVPDYAMIAEILLYAYGFTEARVLSRKIVSTFKLSSEQLSSQDHYDYGMRAVRSVINAAGILKGDYPDMDEH